MFSDLLFITELLESYIKPLENTFNKEKQLIAGCK